MDLQKPRPLSSTFGVVLSPNLRERLSAAATAERISDSAWIRRLLLRHFELESPSDARSGTRFVDDDVQRACALMSSVGQLVSAARDLLPGSRIDGVLFGLEAVHANLVRIVECAENG